MTAAPIADRRSIRAQGIVQAGDIVEVRPGIFHVRDTKTGSGQWHLVAGNACGCIDARRGNRCKHLVARDAWVAQQQPACPDCGAATQAEQFYIGGRGWTYFAVCAGNREHKAVRL
jgi:hypothetical protein